MKKLYLFILLLPIGIYGQNIKDSVMFTPLINISYGFQLPGGDLSKQFGFNHSLGIHGGFKNDKNFQFELGGTFFFGQNIKDSSMLDNLLTEDGFLINSEGEYNNYLISERGFTGTISIGKLFPIIGPNPNSGLLVKFGIGGMRHKVRIDNQGSLVPQLSKENLPYYDRLTFGLTLRQYIGYQHLSNHRLTNFSIGLEVFEGFTRGMRDYQIDLMGAYNDKRFDLLTGIRIGWIVPIYKKDPQEFYIN